MSTPTASPGTELLKEGDVVHFFSTTSLLRDELSWNSPIITARGMELTLTKGILKAYGYPNRPSWLTRLGVPDQHGNVLADRGAWPSDQLRTTPGTLEHQDARDAALKAVWAEYGDGYSAAKQEALRDVERVYGPQTDSWSYSRESGARG